MSEIQAPNREDISQRSVATKGFFWTVWQGVVYAALFGGLGLLGWASIYVPRRGWEFAVDNSLDVYPALWVIAFVPAMLILRKKEPKKALKIACIGCFALTFCLTLFGDRLIPRPGFDFITHRRLTSLNPGVHGISWDIYCFQGSFEDVTAAAKAELQPKGYLYQSGRSVDPPHVQWAHMRTPMEKDDIFPAVQIDVSVGKVTGQYFEIDGHFLNREPVPGWVIVEVSYISAFRAYAEDYLGTAP